MAKHMMRAAALIVSAAIAAGLTGCGEDKAATPKDATIMNIGIVQLVEHDALDAANRGIIDGMAKRGFKDGVNVKFDKQNAQADQSNLHNIATRFVSNNDKLIFAIATPAAQSVASVTKEIPIVATAVTNFEVARLVKSNKAPGGNVTGVSDINPVADQLALLLKLTPGAKAVGTIYNSSEINSAYQIELLREAAKAHKVDVVEATVSNVNDIQQAIASIKDKVQALYIPTDNVMASAIPALLKVTNPAKLPVVAGESGMVRAGALASIGVDYYTLGVMTGNMGADILEGKAQPATMPIQIQQATKVLINMKAAKEIGLDVPAELLKDADKIE
ncbi:MAG: ABC transporter substrate-binding protein [Sutterella wadsworthensis]|nr:ABC transporter substrate-binding protein [Sutterella wadsworthensis]